MSPPSDTHVDTVSLCLPNFWETNITGWFWHFKSQFIARNITKDPTMFSHLMSALDEKIVGRINNLLDVVPEEGAFKLNGTT